MSSASRGSGTRRRMKLRRRDCSRLSTSEIRWSCSSAICSRVAASFTYCCRRMKGGGYCREGLGGTGRLQWVFYGQSEGATSQIGVWGQLPNGLTAGRKRFLCQLSANLHWYRPDRLPEIFRKARLRLGRVFVTVV